MGQFIGKLLSSISWGTKAYGILMVGLDNAGKTTILYKMSMGELVTTIPTIGINIESIKYQNISFTVWDMGGQDKIRPLWRFYFDNTQALIFVIDSNDKDRITEARDELQKLLKNSELSNAKLLVFANKQDMAKVLTPKEITDWLSLNRLKGRDWHVQPCSATTGEGLKEGLDWLANALKSDNSSSKTTNNSKTTNTTNTTSPTKTSNTTKITNNTKTTNTTNTTSPTKTSNTTKITNNTKTTKAVYFTNSTKVGSPGTPRTLR